MIGIFIFLLFFIILKYIFYRSVRLHLKLFLYQHVIFLHLQFVYFMYEYYQIEIHKIIIKVAIERTAAIVWQYYQSQGDAKLAV